VAGRLLAQRAGALKRHLPDAVGGSSHAVHQARVASRRLREAVPVLATGVKGARSRKALGKIRRLTQALGTVRELDVTIQLLDELVAKDMLPRPALEAVRGRVVADLEKRRETMLKRIAHVDLDKLESRLLAMGTLLDETGSEAWRDALGARIVKRSKALSTAIAAAGRLYAPEQLHQVRIAAKKLRYAIELAYDTGVKPASPAVRIVKRAQDTLGRLHDLQVLQSHVAAVQADTSMHTLPDGGLAIVSRALEEECRHLHAAYVAGIPKLADVIEQARAVIVPALAHRARTLKMSLKTRPPARRPAARSRRAAAEVA
jgi:CHAD domain-containing protein